MSGVGVAPAMGLAAGPLMHAPVADVLASAGVRGAVARVVGAADDPAGRGLLEDRALPLPEIAGVPAVVAVELEGPGARSRARARAATRTAVSSLSLPPVILARRICRARARGRAEADLRGERGEPDGLDLLLVRLVVRLPCAHRLGQQRVSLALGLAAVLGHENADACWGEPAGSENATGSR